MKKQMYIGLITAFTLGLALGAEIVTVVKLHGARAIKVVTLAQSCGDHCYEAYVYEPAAWVLAADQKEKLQQLQSDRDQAYGRLDECEGIIKAHKWDDGK